MLGMHLTDERIEGFCKVSVCENVTESAVTIMHHAGIGSLQPNTVGRGMFFFLSGGYFAFARGGGREEVRPGVYSRGRLHARRNLYNRWCF